MIPCSIFIFFSTSSLASVFKKSFENKLPNNFNCWSLFKISKALVYFSAVSSIVFVFFLFFTCIFNRFYLFLNSFSYRSISKFTLCSIIPPWSEGTISSRGRYSYLSILPDDNADNIVLRFFISNLIINCHDFFIYIYIYILSKRFFLNLKDYLM